jgi:hypothetical protein
MELQPTTEKVPARSGVPILVAVAALAFVGLLVARPWDRVNTGASTTASPQPGAGAIAAPGGSGPAATGPQTLVVPFVLPSPDVGPPAPIGEFTLSSAPDEALAKCDYGRPRRGQARLAGIEVQPPIVLLDAGSSVTDIRRIGWWFEVEMKRAERLFDSEWQNVGRSRAQAVGAVSGQPARFTPLTFAFDTSDLPTTGVYRVRVIVEWYTRNVELAGRAEIIANRYQEADDPLIGSWPIYCDGVHSSVP